ncbi:MAG: diguanylate cyclase [Alphaproteobacteria bacterium]|nr:diguanylate cyclase [Alphaproteobacteria bacterium]
MTSDIVQNRYTRKAAPPTQGAGPETRLELTRDQAFLNGSRDIFDILARHSGDPAQNGMDAFSALPEPARKILRNAEETIREQNIRLKSLENLSGVDLLTGLLNAQGFAKAFSAEVARTNRDLSEGGLLVIFNLENLETIEFLYGPEAAESALELVAKALGVEKREMDHAARIRGDEFVLLFAETTMEKALDRLQTMALRLNRISLIWGGTEIRLNLSLGLKSYAKGSRAEDIFTAASADLDRNRTGSARARSA